MSRDNRAELRILALRGGFYLGCVVRLLYLVEVVDAPPFWPTVLPCLVAGAMCFLEAQLGSRRYQKELEQKRQQRIAKRVKLRHKSRGLQLELPCCERLLHTEGDLPAGTRRVRPFAVIHSNNPSLRRVEFELFDGQGEKRLEAVVQQSLEPGDNLVTAEEWLPLDPARDRLDDAWVMKLYLSRKLVAVHRFQRDTGGGPILRHLSGDGELSPALAHTLYSGNLGQVSLDELLRK